MKNYSFSLDRQSGSFIDWKLIVIVLCLLFGGMLSLYSATTASNIDDAFNRQLMSIGLGVVAATVITFIPKNMMRNLSLIIYISSIVLLVSVLLFGDVVYGTKGWLRFGGFSLQPAEFAKFGLICMLAYYLSSKGIAVSNIRDFLIASTFLLLPFGLIFLQPDHGTSSVLLAIFLGILFWTGFNKFFLFFTVSLPFIIILSLKGTIFMLSGMAIFTIATLLFRSSGWISKGIVICVFVGIAYVSPLIYDSLLDHQKARIETFLNPGSDPRGQGYNVIQSMMAVGSGGISGKGFLQGTQTQLRYIPMQWTDFIYSVPTEEFGFIGGSLILLFFGLLLFRTISIAHEADDKFYSVAVFGIATLFFYHTVINIGMVIGLVPVMGIPLPFLSYGGTSMIVNLTMIGFLLNAYRNHRRKRLL
ncbi:MAG: rod shape-determining protein RodA [Candidatus Kapaibacterium sp.]